MTPQRPLWMALGLALAVTAAPVRAHYLWIDPTAGGAPVIRFGEFEEGVIERSPGRLDDMAGTTVSADGSRARTSIAADHIALAGSAPGRSVTAENLAVPVKDWRSSGLGMVKPLYYARWGAGGAPMRLDILPADDTSARVVFGGSPLPKAKVMVHAPNGWSREESTDASGVVRFSVPWRGLYVLEVVHSEDTAGAEGGVAYDRRRHRATLAIARSAGTPTFAAAPHRHDH
jgi:Domain of unknown function (DUF4198)